MITAITASLPDRAWLLGELAASLAQQTVPIEWRVAWDAGRTSPTPILNRLAATVATPWLFRCDDDDLYDPAHFEIILEHLDETVDIVWTWCRIEGRRHPPGLFQRHFDADALRDENYIPSAAAVRTSLWHELGGLRDDGYSAHEDYDLWLRALEHGARFRCVPEVTWTYRLSDAWPHRS